MIFYTIDALLLLTHTLQSSLDKWLECRVGFLDFSSVFDSINHQGLLYKLKFLVVGRPVLVYFLACFG